MKKPSKGPHLVKEDHVDGTPLGVSYEFLELISSSGSRLAQMIHINLTQIEKISDPVTHKKNNTVAFNVDNHMDILSNYLKRYPDFYQSERLEMANEITRAKFGLDDEMEFSLEQEKYCEVVAKALKVWRFNSYPKGFLKYARGVCQPLVVNNKENSDETRALISDGIEKAYQILCKTTQSSAYWSTFGEKNTKSISTFLFKFIQTSGEDEFKERKFDLMRDRIHLPKNLKERLLKDYPLTPDDQIAILQLERETKRGKFAVKEEEKEKNIEDSQPEHASQEAHQ